MALLDIKSLPNTKGVRIEGTAQFSGYEVRDTKTGSQFVSATLRSGTSQIPMKIWNNSPVCSGVIAGKFSGDPVVDFVGVTDVYQGTLSLVVQDMVISDVAKSDVLIAKYDDRYFQGIIGLLKQQVGGVTPPTEVFTLFQSLMSVEGILPRFKEEFAGNHMHDAVRGGLMGHSFKCTRWMGRVLEWYPEITKHLDQRDAESKGAYKNSRFLLPLITALHDLGKIWEYSEGIYSDISWASHRVLANEFFTLHKAEIVAVFGELGYLRLLSAEAQHHGEWEERPRTIEGFVLHLVDQVETHLTILSEGIEQGTTPIKVSGFFLQ